LLYNLVKVRCVKVNKKEKIMTKISKDMNIMDIVQACPESVEVFKKYGLGCIGCAAAHFENLEAGAKVHGFDADAMVDDINALIEK
jgi:hybrid cluster-associated redox disulfide protein